MFLPIAAGVELEDSISLALESIEATYVAPGTVLDSGSGRLETNTITHVVSTDISGEGRSGPTAVRSPGGCVEN